MKSLAMLAAMALLATPAMTAAQQHDPIDEAFARVADAGIPISSLEMLQAEGKARGVPIDVLENAMQRRADALIRARSAMSRGGQEVTESELTAGADALQAGVSDEVLAALASHSGEQSAPAAAVLGVLVELGHVPAEALARVEEALDRGPDALANLQGQAMEARARRGPPSSALDRAPMGVPAKGARDSRPVPPRGRPGGF